LIENMKAELTLENCYLVKILKRELHVQVLVEQTWLVEIDVTVRSELMYCRRKSTTASPSGLVGVVKAAA
jgi:hypothetical protein